MVSRPPSAIASRALTARLTMAFSSWFGSTAAFQRPPARTVSIVTVSPIERPSSSDMSCTSRLMSTDFTSSGCWRENASRRCTNVAARSEAWRELASQPRTRSGPSSRRSARSRLPMMAVSRLLKSCAMPPVRRPTASIFCAWRSFSSVSSRRAISARSISLAAASRRARVSAISTSAMSAAVAGRPKIRWRAMPAIQASVISARVEAGRHIKVDARQLAERVEALLAVDRRPAGEDSCVATLLEQHGETRSQPGGRPAATPDSAPAQLHRRGSARRRWAASASRSNRGNSRARSR